MFSSKLVCETIHRTHVIEDDIANCKQEQQQVCTLRVGCPIYPKTVCSIVKKNNTKAFPETEVHLHPIHTDANQP